MAILTIELHNSFQVAFSCFSQFFFLIYLVNSKAKVIRKNDRKIKSDHNTTYYGNIKQVTKQNNMQAKICRRKNMHSKSGVFLVFTFGQLIMIFWPRKSLLRSLELCRTQLHCTVWSTPAALCGPHSAALLTKKQVWLKVLRIT